MKVYINISVTFFEAESYGLDSEFIKQAGVLFLFGLLFFWEGEGGFCLFFVFVIDLPTLDK